MISDKLFALAFEYKKTKLWKAMWDIEVFGVKLSGGRIGYIRRRVALRPGALRWAEGAGQPALHCTGRPIPDVPV